MRKKKKYTAIFVVKEEGSYGYAGTKKLNATSKTVKFQKGTYFVDINKHTLSKGLELFYYIDIAGAQLKVESKKKVDEKKKAIEKRKKTEDSLILEPTYYDPEVLDLIISKHIVSQLTANLSDNALKMNLITLAAGGIMGGLIGYIVAGVI